MTTQSSYPDSTLPPIRKPSSDPRSGLDTHEADGPEIKAKLRHMMESGSARMTQWKGGIQHSIREKPIQSVLIAAAVGAVVGLLVGRRSR